MNDSLIYWLDKKYVNMLSMYLKDDITIIYKRGTQVGKPTCVYEYNVIIRLDFAWVHVFVYIILC